MASSRYQVEVTLVAAKDLKNVNRHHGPLRPYAVVWVDPNNKCSTRADPVGDSFPVWEQTLLLPLPPGTAVDDATLHVDVVHFGSEDGTNPLIGSARLRLRDVLKDNGGGPAKHWSLQLKRPSGWPHGKVDVKVAVREMRYRAPPTASGVPPPRATRRYATPTAYTAPPTHVSAYGNPHASSSQHQYKRQDPYYGTTEPAGYRSYSGTSHGRLPPSYGQKEKKKSKFGGMGTGLAVGAVAGLFGGLALAEGVEHVRDKISNYVGEEFANNFAGHDDGNNRGNDFGEQEDYGYNGNEQDDGDYDFANNDFAYQDGGEEDVANNGFAYQDDGEEDVANNDFAYQDDGEEDVTNQDEGYEDFAYQDDGEGDVAYRDHSYEDFADQDYGQGDVAYQDNGYEGFAVQEDGEGDVAYQDNGYEGFTGQDDGEGNVNYKDDGYEDFADRYDGEDDFGNGDRYN